MKEKNEKSVWLQLCPLFFCFAVMGFIDILGVSISYVKQDFGLSDKVANLLTSMTLIWFLLISMPTASLMRKIGRKATVAVSLAIMAVAMVLPLAGYSFAVVSTAFALLGIGNTILQVSLNPLLSNVIPEGRMTSALSFGQFAKSVISLLGPVLIGWFASSFGDWTLIFWTYGAATIAALVWLWLTPIERESAPADNGQSGFMAFALLKDPYVLICFLCILMIVGFEICLSTVIPQRFLSDFGMPIEQGGLGCSVLYAMKTAGTFVGGIVLARMSPAKFLKYTSIIAVMAFVVYWVADMKWMQFALIALLGLAEANVFAIAFSLAMGHRPESSNEISALMITGVAGGAILPPLMGLVSDAVGLSASLIVPMAALILLLASALWLASRQKVIKGLF